MLRHFVTAGILCALVGLTEIHGDTVISPSPDLVDTEGNIIEGRGNPPYFHFNWFHSAELFPEGVSQITGIRFRPDRTTPSKYSYTFRDLLVRIGVFDSSLDDFAADFELNEARTQGYQTVFTGDLTFRHQHDERNVPFPFDYEVPFDEPFEYDPSLGNIIIDFDAVGSVTAAPLWDAKGIINPHQTYQFVPAAGFDGFDADFPVVQFVLDRKHDIGDFDGNGQLDAADIDLLSAAVKDMDVDPKFDLNNDGVTDLADHAHWVKNSRQTWIGDANLDGEFNSGDLVEVFQANKYETGAFASWSEGDWNGDQVFASSDFTAAFKDRGYETGGHAGISAVPEPPSIVMVFPMLLGWLGVSRHRVNR